jgi:hypothetical protein
MDSPQDGGASERIVGGGVLLLSAAGIDSQGSSKEQ